MSLSVMLQQLASGMVVSVEIFVVTLLFSLPLDPKMTTISLFHIILRDFSFDKQNSESTFCDKSTAFVIF